MADRDITAQELRMLAEQLDGMRGERKCVVRDDDGSLVAVEATEANLRRAVVTVETRDVDVRDTPLESIQITPPPINVPDIASTFDALFWSQSAVEKFLVPYYARILPLAEVDRLLRSFENKDVYAIGHYPRTVSLALRPQVLHPSSDPETSGSLKFSSLSEYFRSR